MAVGDRKIANELGTELGLRTLVIINGKYLREISEEAVAALVQANALDPHIFSRGTALVELRTSQGGVNAEPLSLPRLRGVLDRAADFVQVDKEGDEKPARPPNDVIEDILTLPSLPLPQLHGITGVPVLLPSGTLLVEDGYNAESGIYLHLDGLEGVGPTMPLNAATSLITGELLVDFPFADQGSIAHTFALLLQPFVRFLITGPTPLYLITAPARGTGKGLLVDVVTIPVTGRLAGVMALPGNDDEMEKRVTACLIAGHPLILIDNVSSLNSRALSAALTSREWVGRILGHSQMVRVQNDAVWVATGNNVSLSDEMLRRVVPIRLDATVERPEERTGFRHALPAWALQHRAQLVSACLSIAQGWVNEGMPMGAKTLGRFEGWAGVIGGILDVAGIEGFLSNRDQLYDQADHESQEWLAFVEAWWKHIEDKPATAKTLLHVAEEADLLVDLRARRGTLAAQQRLGHALDSRRDRIFGKFVIRSAGRDGHTRTVAYRLVLRDPKDAHQNPRNPRNPAECSQQGGTTDIQDPSKNDANLASGNRNPARYSDIKVGVTGVSGVPQLPPPSRDIYQPPDVLEVE